MNIWTWQNGRMCYIGRYGIYLFFFMSQIDKAFVTNLFRNLGFCIIKVLGPLLWKKIFPYKESIPDMDELVSTNSDHIFHLLCCYGLLRYCTRKYSYWLPVYLSFLDFLYSNDPMRIVFHRTRFAKIAFIYIS